MEYIPYGEIFMEECNNQFSYDYVDEKEAHYRGFLFCTSSKTPDSNYYRYFEGDTKTKRGMDIENTRNQVLYLYKINRNKHYFIYWDEKGEKYKTYKPNGK
ncbi:MAG: hypothetical protein E7077_12275 [Bacteroidales bacterium]|nr:hypothetical protein [Bacteroidales bacterium]